MFSVRSVTNLFALENVSAGSMVLFATSGEVFSIPGQDPNNPLFTIDATTSTVTVNGTFTNPLGGPLTLGDGTVGAPSATFLLDTDTGLFRVADNELGIVAGGADPMIVKLTEVDMNNKKLNNVGISICGGIAATISIDNVEIAPTSKLTISDQLITGVINSVSKIIVGDLNITTKVPLHASNGSAAAPAYSFEIDTNTGMYSSGADQISLSTNGIVRLNLDTTKLESLVSVHAPIGTQLIPSYTFSGETTTGMYKNGANAIGFTTNSVNRFNITDTINTSVVKLIVPDGTPVARPAVSDPGFAFATAPNTGFGQGGGLLALISNGQLSSVFGENSIINFAPIEELPGTETEPSYTFQSDTNTGMFNPLSNNNLSFTVNGSTTMVMEQLAIDCKTKLNIGDNGVSNDVSLRWRNSNTIGLWSDDASSLGMTAGSTSISLTLNGIGMSKGVTRPTRGTDIVVVNLDNSDYLVRLEAAVDQTVNLPTAASVAGIQFVLFKTVAGGTATITTTGGDTIDGVGTTLALSTQFDRAVMVSDGNNIWVSI